MMANMVYGIEGLDRLGKSTLIQGIQDALGYYQVIHFAKPQKLKVYEPSDDGYGCPEGVPEASLAAYRYQRESFRNSMIIARSGARVIFDRWHIGEVVYSPMYRGYSGDYVFKQEEIYELGSCDIRLILLVENIGVSKHFVDDGNSLGPVRNREEEQQKFIDAVVKSDIRDKRIIN